MGEHLRGDVADELREAERELARETLRDMAHLFLREGEKIEKKDDVFRVSRMVEQLRQLGRVFALTGVKGAYGFAVEEGHRLYEALDKLHLSTGEFAKQQRYDEVMNDAKVWSPVTHVPIVDVIEAHRLRLLDASSVAKYADTMLRGRYVLAHGYPDIDVGGFSPWEWNPQGEVMMSRGRRGLAMEGFICHLQYPTELSREAEKLIALRNALHTRQIDEEDLLRRKVAFEEELVRHMLQIIGRTVHTSALARA